MNRILPFACYKFMKGTISIHFPSDVKTKYGSSAFLKITVSAATEKFVEFITVSFISLNLPGYHAPHLK